MVRVTNHTVIQQRDKCLGRMGGGENCVRVSVKSTAGVLENNETVPAFYLEIQKQKQKFKCFRHSAFHSWISCPPKLKFCIHYYGSPLVS